MHIQNANKYGSALLVKGKDQSALKLLIRAKKLAQTIEDEEVKCSLIGLTCNSISCVYRETYRIQLAVEYYEKAEAMAKKSGEKGNIEVTYLNGVPLFTLTNNYLKAKE